MASKSEDVFDEDTKDNVVETDLTEALDSRFVTYAFMSLADRALPDARDGLKPSQRRVLVAMNDLKLTSKSSTEKSAKICGDTSGNYHPHGEAVVYPTMYRMAQPWIMREPLLIGQGNFGNLDGDPPAAMRYCLTAGSLLALPDGQCRDIALIGSSPHESDPEQDISLYVLSAEGKINYASKYFNCGEHPVRKLITDEGFEVAGTGNHPLLTIQRIAGKPQLAWKILDKITTDDYVVMQRGGYNDVGIRDFTISEEMAYLLGCMVSEGFVQFDRAGFNNCDKEYFDRFVDIYTRIVGPTFYVNSRVIPSGKTLYEFDVQNKGFLILQKSLIGKMSGCYADTKHVPSEIWNAPLRIKRAFLSALFEGDGCVSIIEDCVVQVSYSTKSAQLAKDVQQMLLMFGVVSRKTFDENRQQFCVYLSSRNEVENFSSNVGFASAKIAALSDAIEGLVVNGRGMVKDFVPFLSDYVRSYEKRLKWVNIDRLNKTAEQYSAIASQIRDPEVRKVYEDFTSGRYFYAKVKYNDLLPEKECVFSIRVDSICHSFVANGFVNHNTEAKMSPVGEAMLDDLHSDIVPFVPNYNEKRKEPTILPGKFPNLLVNGAQGIAVGWATVLPPHNLREVVSVIRAYIKNPAITPAEIIQLMPGPDFPTGGKILGQDGIMEYYRDGRGSVRMEGKWDIHKSSKGIETIIVTELPYQSSPEGLSLEIKELVESGKLTGLADLKNLSSKKTGIQVVIEVARGKGNSAALVLNNLLKNTSLRKTFSVNQTVLIGGKVVPDASVMQLVAAFVDHRKLVLTNKYKLELESNLARIHIIDGMIRVSKHIKEVVDLILASENPEAAAVALIKAQFVDTDVQAKAVLEIKLSQLTKLETTKLADEKARRELRVDWLRKVLSDENEILSLISREQDELAQKMGTDRRTEIVKTAIDVSNEDLVKDENLIVTLTIDGYIRSLPVDAYKIQHRGGKGVIGAKETDAVSEVFESHSKGVVLFFTNLGLVYNKKAYQIPQGSRTSKGTHVSNLLSLKEGEKVTNMIALKSIKDPGYLVIATKRGLIKRSEIAEYDTPRINSGITAIKMNDGDSVAFAMYTDGNRDIFIVTAWGNAVRYSENLVSVVGRISLGVKALKLDEDDQIAQVLSLDPSDEPKILVTTKGGFAKQTDASQFPAMSGRHVRGYAVIKKSTLEKNGEIIGACSVSKDDSILVLTEQGQVVRINSNTVRETGRTTAGVRAVRLNDGDSVVRIARLKYEEGDEEEAAADEIVAVDDVKVEVETPKTHKPEALETVKVSKGTDVVVEDDDIESLFRKHKM